MNCCGCYDPITGPHTILESNGKPVHWVCVTLAKDIDGMDDAIHIASPDGSGRALCGLPNRRNLAALTDPRPGGASGCWTCLLEAARLEADK